MGRLYGYLEVYSSSGCPAQGILRGIKYTDIAHALQGASIVILEVNDAKDERDPRCIPPLVDLI